MRIGIIGSRTYQNKRKIRDMIFKLKQEFKNELTIVSGGCPDGADKFAKKYALELDCKYLEFNPAHTQRNLYSALHDAYYGKDYAAKWFFQRNKMLANYVDYLIAFQDIDSKGTNYTINEAKKRGKKVVIMT
jgi:predicted Rossmann fold nucleotide-binding protein DprA/Smf involved in DNA uptake